ncbi:hypothetical protein AB3M92_08555 [Micrococcus luteus]|uniref:hypothetical protein n=1 Tax=Micrococcus luteus TaxID=1270 RepID=UPI0039A1F581
MDERPRKITLIGKLSALHPLSEVSAIAARNGYKLEIIGEPAWNDSAPPELNEVIAGTHVEHKGFVWPWEVGRVLQSTRVACFLEKHPEEILTHSGALPLEAMAAGAAVALPHRRASIYQIPKSSYLGDLTALEEALRDEGTVLQNIADSGAGTITELLSEESPLIAFSAWAKHVETVLLDAQYDTTTARSSTLTTPKNADNPRHPVTMVAKGDGAVTADSVLIRRRPLRLTMLGEGKWQVIAEGPGFVPNAFLLSETSKAILSHANGDLPLSRIDGLADAELIDSAESLRKAGLITVVNDVSLFDSIPPLKHF